MENVVFLGDCLEEMDNLIAKGVKVNLVCIDPPYNIGKDKNWDKWDTVNAYVEFMGQVFDKCTQLLKENGSLYFFHNDFLQIVELQNWLNQNSELVFKQLITWNKIDPSFNNYGFVQQRLSVDRARNYYNGFTEYCLFYVKNDNKHLHDKPHFFEEVKTYLKEEWAKTGLKKKDLHKLLGNFMGGHYFGNTQWQFPSKENYEKLQTTGCFKTPYEVLKRMYLEELEGIKDEKESLQYPFNVQSVKDNLRANSNVWFYPPAKNLGHITPKNVELIKNILLHSTNEGDLVLDCFGGSGTTAVACKELNRKYILIEKEAKYFDLIMQRLRH